MRGKTILSYYRSTRFKMKVAAVIFAVLRSLHVKQKRVVRRKSLRFELDLAEGIDLSIFLFGGFQQHVTSKKLVRLPDDAVIFDVGANVGSISLVFAAMYSKALVYAFEPTHYAFAKLKRNINLNVDIVGERVIPVQAFVSAAETEGTPVSVYSSWRIDQMDGDRHPVHLGILKSGTDKQIALDSFVRHHALEKVDLIKIDTDGHELGVLKGALDTIRRFRPTIIFELSTYLMKEQGVSFSAYEELLLPQGYRLMEMESGREVHEGNVEGLVPPGGSIDIVAIPSSKSSWNGKAYPEQA